MRVLRISTVVVIAAVLPVLAAASDDPADAQRQPAPQAQSEAVDAPQTESGSGEPGSDKKPRPVLDRRDRIFYPGDTERLKPLGRKLVLNVLFDQEEIFTSPFRMNRQNAKWWVLFGATTAGLIAADHHIADAFENSR